MSAEIRNIRYEPNESPPRPLAFGLACQYAALSVAGIVLTPAIIVRAAGGEDSYVLWAAFAALVVSGISTIMQAVGYKRVGAGYILLMGTSGAFIAISITALAKGGPSLLATLVFISALFQFFLSYKLALFRKIFTSTVGGTVIMLVAVTIMPIVFNMLSDVPEPASTTGAVVSALTTVMSIVLIVFLSSGILRLWAPAIGIVLGCIVSSFYGLFDTSKIAAAPWFGLPLSSWPGLSFDFSPSFWILLPSFIFVTIVGAIETVGDAVAIQQVSWRKPRSVDFRSIQGAVSADGVGNLLSGLLSTIPNTTYSNRISLVELTGVAARKVGMWIGAVLILLAFFPKVVAAILSIPGPVAAGYLGVLLSLLFVVGMQLVIKNGDYRKCMIAAIGFWVGYGFQNKVIFTEQIDGGGTLGVLLQDGMTAGGLVVLFLSILMELVSPRKKTIKTKLHAGDIPKIHAFLSEFATDKKWGKSAAMRLCTAGEEVVLSLLNHQQGDVGKDDDDDDDDEDEEEKGRHFMVTARGNNKTIELECIAARSDENLEDKMILLKERAESTDEGNLSLRILTHVTSSFQHQQYHDTDIITVKVDA